MSYINWLETKNRDMPNFVRMLLSQSEHNSAWILDDVSEAESEFLNVELLESARGFKK